MVNREVDANKIRNHVLRMSLDGGASFGAPVEISNDGWQVPSCPHSGPSLGRDRRGHLHVSWFTQGRTEQEAGIYYSVSKDGGKTWGPPRHFETDPNWAFSNPGCYFINGKAIINYWACEYQKDGAMSNYPIHLKAAIVDTRWFYGKD